MTICDTIGASSHASLGTLLRIDLATYNRFKYCCCAAGRTMLLLLLLLYRTCHCAVVPTPTVQRATLVAWSVIFLETRCMYRYCRCYAAGCTMPLLFCWLHHTAARVASCDTRGTAVVLLAVPYCCSSADQTAVAWGANYGNSPQYCCCVAGCVVSCC